MRRAGGGRARSTYRRRAVPRDRVGASTPTATTTASSTWPARSTTSTRASPSCATRWRPPCRRSSSLLLAVWCGSSSGARCGRSSGSVPRSRRSAWPSSTAACRRHRAGDEIARLAATMNDMLARLDTRSSAPAALRRRRLPRAAHAADPDADRARGRRAPPGPGRPAATRRSLLDEIAGLQRLIDDLLAPRPQRRRAPTPRHDARRPRRHRARGGPALRRRRRSTSTSATGLGSAGARRRRRAAAGRPQPARQRRPPRRAARHGRARASATATRCLTVADDGPGHPASGPARDVFERFTPPRRVPHAATGGAGLGSPSSPTSSPATAAPSRSTAHRPRRPIRRHPPDGLRSAGHHMRPSSAAMGELATHAALELAVGGPVGRSSWQHVGRGRTDAASVARRCDLRPGQRRRCRGRTPPPAVRRRRRRARRSPPVAASGHAGGRVRPGEVAGAVRPYRHRIARPRNRPGARHPRLGRPGEGGRGGGRTRCRPRRLSALP